MNVLKKKKIFLVPNIVIFRFLDFVRNLIILRKEKNYFFKEDYISFLDLMSVFKINKGIKNIFF